MREIGITDMNFLSDDRFLGFQKTLDARMKQLHSSGIGVSRKQAEPITPNKEERLWQSGQLGDGSSQSLFSTVFYYNCKLFGMRAMDEHRSLKCSQFSVGYEGNLRYIEFTGRSSKTLAGGLRQRNIDSKCIRHYSTVSRERCLHALYGKYLSL